jgi:Ca2+-binding EF-hand superfamily protein
MLILTFKTFDIDGSGDISKDDFVQIFSNKGFSQDKIVQAFETLDVDQDGGISRKEFDIFAEGK